MKKISCKIRCLLTTITLVTGAILLMTVCPYKSGQGVAESELMCYFFAGLILIIVGFAAQFFFYRFKSSPLGDSLCAQWGSTRIRNYQS